MKRYKTVPQIKREVEKMIWRTDDRIICFKAKKIEREGFFPHELESGRWKLKTKNKYGNKLEKLKSDNIDWICRLDVVVNNL